MNALLVINAGSSSIKFAAFDHATTASDPKLIAAGHVAYAGAEVELQVKAADGTLLEHSRAASGSGGNGFDPAAALTQMFGWLEAHRGGLDLAAVGHRVVHGGADYSAPVRVTDAVLRDLDRLVPLAPLHQPHNLKAIHVVAERWPALPQVACFDTAFHHAQAPVERALALPREVTAAGVRRYGFHGLSYEYITTQLQRVLGPRASGRVIVAHLGNGASLCAIAAGKSVATTMGFSVLDGLVMGTRSGLLDPGVVLYLLQEMRMTAAEISDLLYSRSGLLGVSGISGDMEVLLGSSEPDAVQAIELFVYRIVREIGSLAAALGGVDALVFCGGIGEHAAPVRAQVVAGCAWLGAHVDESANSGGHELIHAATSAVALAVVPTNEELMIALHTQRCSSAAAAAPRTGCGH